MVELSFDLDEKICKMLEEMAKDENKSESEVVQEAIMEYCLDKQAVVEELEHLKTN